MPETLHPGLYVFEKSSIPSIEGVSTVAVGMVGQSVKGPTDLVGLITSFTQYQDVYGGFRLPNTTASLTLPNMAKIFFDNGGKRLYVMRAVGSGGVFGVLNIDPNGDPDNTIASKSITIVGKTVGSWVNALSVTTRKANTKVKTAINNTGGVAGLLTRQTIEVDSVAGFEIGDVLVIKAANGTFTSVEVVVSINTTTPSLIVGRLGLIPATTGTLGIGSTIETATTHRATTTIATAITTAIVNGNNSIATVDVASASGLKIGDLIFIIDNNSANATSYGNVLEGRITAINNKTLSLDTTANTQRGEVPTGNTGGLPVGSIVTTLDFKLVVSENSVVQETHDNLSIMTASNDHFISNKLQSASTSSVSSRIYGVIDGVSGTPYTNGTLDSSDIHANYQTAGIYRFYAFLMPLPSVDKFLTSGTDVAPSTDANFTDALDKFTTIDDISAVAVPGSGAGVVKYGISWAETRGDVLFVCEGASTDDTPSEIINYRNVTLNVDNSYGALYYPYVKVKNPENSSELLTLPPSGHVLGAISKISSDSGVHFPPANIALNNIDDLTYNVTDAEHDTLNPIGINVLRTFTGRGVRIFGARTLWKTKDGRHYVNVRRLLNFIKDSIKTDLQDFVFKPNNSTLWTAIETSLTSFLTSLWSQGMLFPANDIKQAFFVKCDSETNPQSSVDVGRVVAEIGVNPVRPAEFVIFNIQIIDGSTLITET